MGKTSDSAKKGFGRELGKNSADYLSNKIFGDKWSTPHRVAVSVQKEQIRAKAQEREAAALEAQLEYEKEKDFDKKLESINGIVFTTDKNEITNILSKVISIATSTFSKDGYEKETQPIIKACIEKAEEGIYRLKSISEVLDADFYQKRLEIFNEDIKSKKLKDKRTTIGMLILIFVGLGFILLMAFVAKHNK